MSALALLDPDLRDLLEAVADGLDPQPAWAADEPVERIMAYLDRVFSTRAAIRAVLNLDADGDGAALGFAAARLRHELEDGS